MGLENLKSAFSNIESKLPTPEKQGVGVNPSISTSEKSGTDIQDVTKTDLSTMVSKYSILTEPQEVNYMADTHATGFTAYQVEGNDTMFVGVEQTEWNSTTGFYTVSNVTVPGPVDWLHNDHATGFSLDQVHQSPTKFTGAGEHSTVPYMEWTNNSLYGNVLGDTYIFDNGLPAIDATTWEIPTDFTYQNSQYGVNAISDTFSETWTYEDGSGITPNNIPPHGTTWTIPTDFTYQDIIHTTNTISDAIFGPVDFMTGENSYYSTVNPAVSPSGIPGFTTSGRSPNTEFNIGGYTFADADLGNSKYLNIGTGTHTTIPIHPFGNQTSYLTGATSTFSDTVGGWFTSNLPASSDETWTIPTGFTYQDSIHTTNALSGTGNEAIGGPVNFMDGTNSYYSTSLSPVSGFTTSGRSPNTEFNIGGYTFADGTAGNSKYLNEDGTAAISTGTHTTIPIHPYGNQSSYLTGATSTFSDTAGGWFTSSLPASGDETWNIPSGFTYQDILHTTNTISDTFNSGSWAYSNQIPTGSAGNTDTWNIPSGFTYSGNGNISQSLHSLNPSPLSNFGVGGSFSSTGSLGTGYLVDFMSGKSLHELSLVGSASISGFTNYSLPYNLGSGIGNSELLDMWSGDAGSETLLTSLWTGYYGAHTAWTNGKTYSDTIAFTGVASGTGFNGFLQGQTQLSDSILSSSATGSYYDSIHTRNTPLVVNGVTYGITDSVNFMSGKSQHEASLANSASISGFTKDFDSKGTGIGDSKLLDLWNTEWKENGLLTSMWTGMDENYNTMEFPGPYGSFDLNVSPLSASSYGGISDDPLQRTWTPSTNYFDTGSHPRNYSPLADTFDINSSLSFSTSITASSGNVLEVSKGSNKGGAQSLQFNLLYNDDHTATDNKYAGPVQDGSDINVKDRFKLKQEAGGLWGADQPYIVREIGSSKYNIATRIIDDTFRLGKFLISSAGIVFIVNQNILGTFQQYQGLYDPFSTLMNAITPAEGLSVGGLVIPIPFIPFSRSTGPLVKLAELLPSVEKYNATYPEYLTNRKDDATMTYAETEREHTPLGFKVLGGGYDEAEDSNKPIDKGGIDKTSGVTFESNMNTAMDSTKTPLGGFGKGDIFTLSPMKPNKKDIEYAAIDLLETDGMPFYIRDLRDSTVIFFRAYLEGLSETISPSWSSENYVGRSEPVYTYTNAEREINFNLKLFAQTKDELNQIYTKLNRLTSLCYPQYKKFEDPQNVKSDEGTLLNSIESRVMMKPPLTKFRLGELYGSPLAGDASTDTDIPSSAEMVGFIKSLSYTFPDESPWEIQAGYRVPKYIDVSLGYQVIHTEVPSLEFALKNIDNAKQQKGFYGINQTLFSKMDPDTGTIGTELVD